jgi:polyhydroxybutyrate depolymerase
VAFWRRTAETRRRPARGPGSPGRALFLVATAATFAVSCAGAAPSASPAPPTSPPAATPGSTAATPGSTAGSTPGATAGSTPGSTAGSTTGATGGTTPPARATRSPGCDRPADAAADAQTNVALQSSGLDRTYQQHVPASAGTGPAPLVIDLHGYLSGAAGQAAMSNLAATADRAGFVLATPQGNGPLPYWNAVPHAELPDDVQFISDIIDDVSDRVCIDPSRVYVDGLSNGAFLTSLVACRLADKVAAVAAVAGLLLPADCAPSRPIPILAIHGTADRFVTFDGSPNVALESLTWNAESTKAFEGLPFAAAPDTLAKWAALEGCAERPEREPVRGSVTVVRYRGCRDGSAVELYVVDGAGHTWPGSAFSRASEAVLGPTTTDIDANELIWSFFEAHPMPH